MKYIIAGVVLLCVLTWGGIANRHSIVIQLMSSGEPPPLNAATDEGADTVWFDDYFTVQALDERTFAITQALRVLIVRQGSRVSSGWCVQKRWTVVSLQGGLWSCEFKTRRSEVAAD